MKTKNKDLNKLLREANKQGWKTFQVNNGHIKWVSPVGDILFSSFSPSDINAIKQIKRQLLANGFIIIQKGKR